MKYRSMIIMLLLTGILAGCAEKTPSENSEPPVTAAPHSETTTARTTARTTTTITTTEAVTTTIAPDMKIPESSDQYTYTIQHNGLDEDDVLIIFDKSGNQVGKLLYEYWIDDREVNFGDYNFDGYDDLFFGSYRGEFWEFDPEKNSLVRSDDLQHYDFNYTNFSNKSHYEIDYEKSLRMYVSDKEEKICVHDNSNLGHLELEEKLALTYPFYYEKVKWQGDCWQTLKRNETEIKKDGTIYLKSYEADENCDLILTKRYYFDTETQRFVETDTDIEYVYLTEDSFMYMKGNNIIQRVEFGTELEAVKNGTRSIEFNDYNFDGYDDIMCRYSAARDDQGNYTLRNKIYYLFDPEKNEYVMSDQLNGLVSDPLIPVHIFNDELYFTEEKDDVKNTYFYRWENDILKISGREESMEDGTVQCYGYDEDGNEYITEKRQMPVAETPTAVSQAPLGTQLIQYVYDEDGNLVYEGQKSLYGD